MAPVPDPAVAAPAGPANPGRPPRRRWGALAAPVASAALLLVASGWGLTLPNPGDADPFHAHVVAVAAEAPMSIGPYKGRHEEVATEAVELLHPNVILSRSFLPDPDRTDTGEKLDSPWVQFLMVQVRDARDILGHWPPVCYIANGYSAGSTQDVSWEIDGRSLPGRRYHFSIENAAGVRSGIVVANFLVLPDGRVVRDMSEVIEAGGDYRIRYFGAAQVQVLTPEGISDEARLRVENLFLQAHSDLITAMSSRNDPDADTR